ncbi:ATP-grasp domain-containing protein [Acidobacteriota bacterium]
MFILITDIHFRKTFDIFNIISSEHPEYTPVLCDCRGSFLSRLIAQIIYPSKIYKLRKSNYEVFERDLKAILDERRDSEVVYLPVEEDTSLLFYEFVSNNSHPNLHFNLPSLDSFSTARNKKSMSDFCRQKNIPVPLHYSTEELQELKTDFRPVVVKPREGGGAKGLFYIDTPDKLSKLDKLDLDKFIVQERVGRLNEIEGGFFLFDQGKPLSFYSHQRIRTYPRTGGVSVYSRIGHNEKIQEIGESLLRKLDWSGIAMIEFMYDGNTEEYKVIEVNARLWGSILLPQKAGLNFLKKYIDSALGQSVESGFDSRDDVFIRWLFPFDLLNYIRSFGQLKGFWKMNKEKTCYINFTYSKLGRSLLYTLYLNLAFIGQLLKKLIPFGK